MRKLPTEIIYVLNQQNQIVDANSEWNKSAIMSDALELTIEKIVGEPLFRFIKGDDTRIYMDTILRRVRQLDEEVVRKYRCDTPTHKRYMEMLVTPHQDRKIVVSHQLVHQEPLHTFKKFVFTPDTICAIKRCSICNRIQIDEKWLEPEDAFEALRSLGEGLNVFYGVCMTCRESPIVCRSKP